MSNKAALLPLILEKVFEKYSASNIDNNLGDLFVELNALLTARVVKAALNLLDHQCIVVYHNIPKTKQVAQVNESSSKIIWLFPHVNYCTCTYFQEQVLGAKDPSTSSYTCEHVLALRLAHMLKSDKVRFEELAFSKLKVLLSNFLPEDNHQSD
uniref:SWIM-type domain-containing protein n=1 Tax=Stomoxys calcitrans TaxID=35570 RepID=A0A1I8PMI2_STOCA